MPDGDLLLDTGGWLFALAGRPAFAEALESARRPIVPGLVLAEVDYHLRERRREMRRLLDEIGSGQYEYEPPTLGDLARARQIDQKFASLKLGLVDASIAALAERLGVRRVLSTDPELSVVRIGTRWNTPLDLVVPASRSAKRRRT